MVLIMVICLFKLYSQDVALQRPEPAKIMSIISELNLTEQQRADIEEDLYYNLKKYDKIKKKYDKKLKEKEEIEKEISELKNLLLELNKNVVVIIRSYLTEEQKVLFSSILKKQKEKIDIHTKSETTKETEKKQDGNVEIKDTKEKTSPFDIYFP